MNRIRIALTLIVAAIVSNIGSNAQAECSASVSAVVSGETLTVTGTASGSCGTSGIVLYLDNLYNTIGTKNCDGPSCTLTVEFPTTCLSSGSHFVGIGAGCHRTEGQSCAGDQGGNTTTFTVNTTPTVSVTYNGPDSEGKGTVEVSYNFPNTTSASQRGLILGWDGGWFLSAHPEQKAGTWSVPLNVSCWPTGSHIIKTQAFACGQPYHDPASGMSAEAETAVTVSNKPSVAVSYVPPSDSASTTVQVNYSFPNTSASGQRRVLVYLDGATLASFQPLEQEGVWTQEIVQNCSTQQLRALAIACGDVNGDPAYRDEDETTLPKPENPKVSVALTKSKDEPGKIEAKLDYDMGNSPKPWSVSLDRLAWTDADGKINPRVTLFGPVPPTQQVGTVKLTLTPPSGAQQVTVEASAATCVGTDKRVASIECDACEKGASADPVFFSTGNVRVTDGDALPPIATHRLVRTYNSDEQVVALFGRGWTTLFDRRMILNNSGGEQLISFVTQTNQVVTFAGAGGVFQQLWPRGRRSADTLSYDAIVSTYSHRPAGSSEVAVFRSDGRLVALRELATGREARITYDAQGLPQTFTDSWTGVQWILTIDAANRRVGSIAVTGRPDLVWSYSYDGAGNLLSVTAPGSATWRTYEYSANRMTASHDAVGHLIESHTYDANGYGISSTGPSDEIADIDYNLPGAMADERVTRVTYKTGATAEYALRPVGGAYRVVRVTGGCSSCGAGDATYVRDDEGRVLREQGADGYIAVRTYTATNLVSEERFLKPSGCDPETDVNRCRLSPDALATASLQSTSATITTTFVHGDPLWPDKVTGIITPSVRAPGRERREDHAYHPASGVVVSTAVRGWTGDEPTDTDRVARTMFYGDVAPCDPEGDGCEGESDDGLSPTFNPNGTFNAAWLTVPQPVGLRKSVDGTRVDVQDVTSFVYYPIDPSVPALLHGRLAATKNAAGHMTHYESYDIFGNATRVVDANGVAVEVTFDTLGRLVTTSTKGVTGCDIERDPLCATDLVSERTYAGAGPLTTEESPASGVTTYTYDSRGRIQTISRGTSATDLQEQIEYTYDPLTGKKSLERILASESGAWVEKRREAFAYDAEGRLQTTTHADGALMTFAYDAADRLASIRDENHTAPNTWHQYDPAGRLATVRQSLASAPGGAITTSYAYDDHGNLVSVTDPNGNLTTYVYGDFRQMLEQSSPVTGVATYTYDDAGNLLSATDDNGATTTRTYDALGRVTAALSATGGEGSAEEVRWTFDTSAYGVGRLASMNDPTGSTSYAYERRGLLASEVKTIGGTAYSTGYGYDANGNRSRITYPSGRLVTYVFDYADRQVSAFTGFTALVTSTRYLPFGPLTEIAFGNGTVKKMSFDARYRPLTNTLSNGGDDAIGSYSYGYDPAGNITALHDVLDPSFNRDFGYDDLHRLTTANTGEALWGAGSYTYDRMGNMQAITLGTRNDVAFSYQGTTPKLSSVTENGNNRAVAYDAAGNEMTAGTASYEYTARNHLARQNNVLYTYDGRGVRTITLRPASILAFNVPSTINGGSSAQGEVVLSSPATAGGAVVTLTSSSAVASVPESITIEAGQTSAVFTIATQVVTGEQNAVLTASFNGSVRTATVLVAGSRFDEVFVEPQSIIGGDSARGTLSLRAPAPEGGLAVSLESSSTAIRIPESVIVPRGERVTEFPVMTGPVAETTVARITASAEGEGRETSLTILPPSLIALAFTPSVLNGGSSTTGTVTLNGRAPESGLTVALTSASDMLTTPQIVAVATGERAATFIATATPVEVEASVPVTATAGEHSVTAQVTIEPPHLTDLIVTPASVVGGEPFAAEVTINAPSAPEGARVQLSTSDPAIVSVPTHVFVPSGETTEITSATTGPVTAPTPVVVSATRSGITRSATVTIEPPGVTVASFSIAPTSLVGTNETVATVTLTGVAPVGGVEIELTSSDRTIVAPPLAFTVPANVTQATFPIETSLVAAPTSVVITAAHATTQKGVTLTVLPPSGNYVADVSVSPAFIVGGTTAIATVTLALPSSESGGSDVVISSSSSEVAAPPSVKINPNSSSATFTVTATQVTEPVAVTLTATYGGVVRRTRVIVAPENAVTIGSLAITPDRVIGGTSTTGVVTLSGPAPFGGAVVNLEARRRNMVTMPATVTIPEGATSAMFSIATQIVHGNKDRSLEITAAYNGVATTETLTVTPSQMAASVAPVALCASAALEPCLTRTGVQIATMSAPIYDRQYNLYTPELSLLAETAATVGSAPSVAYEYIWFAGQPLAQVDVAANAIRYYFNDHLGTPILQTDADTRVAWHAEYEPFGNVYAMRRGEETHQPLRLPGQEGDDEGLHYNIYRWYRAGWGRYTQIDPARLDGDPHPYAYAEANPLRFVDPYGLKAEIVCASIGIFGLKKTPAKHCRLRVTCDDCEPGKFGGPYDTSLGLERNRNTGKLEITDQPIPASYGDAYPIEGVDQENSCQFGKCVRSHNALFKKQGKAAQWESQYSIFGPNSNTYVAYLIYLCGGWVSFPPGAVGGDSGWFK